MGAEPVELSGRRGAILRVIVAEYVASANPVASEVIARGHSLGVSPATTRHEMARLEEDGFVTRPHTSAGAVPSDKGYRYYVECLIKESRLSREDQLTIRRFFREAEHEPESWPRLAVTILTQRLESIAVATLPRAPVCHFRHVDLVALQELLVLLVLVLQEGTIQKRLLTAAESPSQDDLTALANRLNALCQGMSRREISARDKGLSPIDDQVLGGILQMMEAEDKRQHEQLYLDGLRYLVGQTEFIKGNRMLHLVEALEDKSMLVSLLQSLGGQSGVKVTIGNENEEEALQDCSVILSNYGVDERRGTIGVIGPTRMPYSKAIPIVDYVSSVMSDMVSRIYA